MSFLQLYFFQTPLADTGSVLAQTHSVGRPIGPSISSKHFWILRQHPVEETVSSVVHHAADCMDVLMIQFNPKSSEIGAGILISYS